MTTNSVGLKHHNAVIEGISSIEETMVNQNTELEQEEIKHLNDHFKYVKSKCSSKISDIQGFIYGGITSRFWIYRKHILSMDIRDVVKDSSFTFFPWECITILLKHREVDLVIRNEEHMKLFIRFLVYSLKTVDGNKNSAEGIHRALFNQEVASLRKKCINLTPRVEDEIREKIRHQTMLKTSLKYTICKVRQKISFIAFRK